MYFVLAGFFLIGLLPANLAGWHVPGRIVAGMRSEGLRPQYPPKRGPATASAAMLSRTPNLLWPPACRGLDSVLGMRSDGLRPQYPSTIFARQARIDKREFGLHHGSGGVKCCEVHRGNSDGRHACTSRNNGSRTRRARRRRHSVSVQGAGADPAVSGHGQTLRLSDGRRRFVSTPPSPRPTRQAGLHNFITSPTIQGRGYTCL